LSTRSDQRHRVLLVETDGRIGGSGRSLQTLIAGLDRARFDLWAICPPDGPIGRRINGLGVECRWPAGHTTHGRWIGSRAAWVWGMRRLIRRLRIDLVHVNDVEGFRLAGLAARLSGVPSVCHVRMARSADDLAWSFGLAGPAAMIFNSRAMAEHMLMLLPPSLKDLRAVIAPNAVDTDRFRSAGSTSSGKAQLGWPTDVAAVTVVGNLMPLKGQDVFIEAARHVSDRFDGPVAFHMVGRDLTADGQFSHQLQRQIGRLGLGGQVHLHGAIDDVVPVYQASDVVACPVRPVSCCPSGDGKRVYQVGFPRCVIETAACGRPIVLADTPGAEEAAVPDETGLFVPPEDPDALARAILALLNDPDRREAMGRAARELAESRFGIKEHGRLIARVYQSVLGASEPLPTEGAGLSQVMAAGMRGGSAR